MMEQPRMIDRLARWSWEQFFNRDAPIIIWNFTKYKIEPKIYIKQLTEILKYQPLLLLKLLSLQEQYQKIEHQKKKLKEEIEKLHQELDRAEEQAAELQAQIDTVSGSEEEELPLLEPERPVKPSPHRWEILLTIGLSLMLLLGMCQFFGLDLRYLRFEQLPQLSLCLSGAIMINIAEFLGVYRFSVASRSRRASKRQQNVSIFYYLRTGDPVFLVCCLIVGLEVSFGAPGLVSLLPPDANLISQLTVYAAAGLAAFVNLLMALGNALGYLDWKEKDDRWQQQHQEKLTAHLNRKDVQEQKSLILERKHQEEAEIRKLVPQFTRAKKRVERLFQKQSAKKQELENLQNKQKDFQKASQKWEAEVKDLLFTNPDLISKTIEKQELQEKVTAKQFLQEQQFHELKSDFNQLKGQLNEQSKKLSEILSFIEKKVVSLDILGNGRKVNLYKRNEVNDA